mmetsp:Transcript_40930/g.67152  ORF Transcript_40930/g.67152 Transcript_40930/m.67152 type:complete len:113 (+) Transcript_40930:173-511(+)
MFTARPSSHIILVEKFPHERLAAKERATKWSAHIEVMDNSNVKVQQQRQQAARMSLRRKSVFYQHGDSEIDNVSNTVFPHWDDADKFTSTFMMAATTLTQKVIQFSIEWKMI